MNKLKPLSLEWDFDFESGAFVIFEKETKDVVIIGHTAFGGVVNSANVVYKSAGNHNENTHLNLTGFLPQNFNKYIGVAIDDEYIYVQYLRLYGPSWGRRQSWTMRKYKYSQDNVETLKMIHGCLTQPE